jgi:hypothetical protein
LSHKAGADDAAFAGNNAFAFKHLAEGFEELAAARTPALFDALLEVPQRFGIGDVVADAQADEVLEAGAVEDLLLGGVVAQSVELLQHEDLEHELGGGEGWFAALFPVARGLAGEFFEQRAEALPGDDVAQLEDAGACGGDGLLVFAGAEESSSSFGLALAFRAPLHGSQISPMKVALGEMRFP